MCYIINDLHFLWIPIFKDIYNVPWQKMFCNQETKENALEMMNVAVLAKHHQAKYCLNFMKLFSGIKKYQDEGIQGLSNLTLADRGELYVSESRWDLGVRLKSMVCYNQEFFDIPMFCRVDDDKFLDHIRANFTGTKHCARCVADLEVINMEAEFRWAHR